MIDAKDIATTCTVGLLGHVQREAVERHVRDWNAAAFAAEWSPPTPGGRFSLILEEEDVALVRELVIEGANRLWRSLRDGHDPTIASEWRALERVAARLHERAPCEDYDYLFAAIGPTGNTLEHLARAWGRSLHMTESALTAPRMRPVVERRADGRWYRRPS